jgi:hypothetical protein
MNRSVTRNLLLSALLATAAVAPAHSQVTFNISIAPPAPQYEPAPQPAPGYVWAPGYWGWHGDRYVWVRGRSIVQRTGYNWEPDRWEQRDGGYYRHAGNWARDPGYKPVKVKKEKKSKHREDDDDHDRGNGHGGKHGKGNKHDR